GAAPVAATSRPACGCPERTGTRGLSCTATFKEGKRKKEKARAGFPYFRLFPFYFFLGLPSCAAFTQMKCPTQTALPLQAVNQAGHQLPLAGGGGGVEVVHLALPLAAAQQRAGVAEEQQPLPGARQGQGQGVRPFTERNGPV